MFKVGDVVRLRIVNSLHASSTCAGRDGKLVTVVDIGSYIDVGDGLYYLVRFEDGRTSGTHAMNLAMAHGPCPMEVSNV